MLSKNAIMKIKSIIESYTDKEYIITEINLTDNFSEYDIMGKTMCINNIFLSDSYNAFVCLRDFTDKETNSMCERTGLEEGLCTFIKGDVFAYNKNDRQYIYYCNVNDVEEKIDETNETKELLQTVNILKCCQKVLDKCDNNKEIWEKVKKMIDIYFE